MPTTGKLVDMTASAFDAPPVVDTAASTRVALALGMNGALGEELLAQLVADPRYSWVHVGLRHSIGPATPKYRPWVIGQSTILADDAYLCLSDDPTPAVPSPIARFRATDALRAIDIARAAGARRLMIIATEASAPDERNLDATEFGTLVLVRLAVPSADTDRGWVGRALDAIGRVAQTSSNGSPIPTSRTTATSLLAAFDRLGPGLHRITLSCGSPSLSRS